METASRSSTKHIISRKWPPDPLQLELTDRLDLHGVLDLRQHSRADEDLTRLGFVAKTGGHVRHRADGGIIEAPLITNRAERGKAVRYTDAEAKVMSPLPPLFRQVSDCITHFKSHEHGLKRRVLYWHWIVEHHHHAVTGVAFERAVVLDDDFANGCMIVAQQRHHVFRVG